MALIKRRSLSTVFFLVCLSLFRSITWQLVRNNNNNNNNEVVWMVCIFCAFTNLSGEAIAMHIQASLRFILFLPLLALSLFLAVAHCLFEFPCYEINMWCKRFCFIRYVHLLLCQCVHNNNESINPFLVDVSSRSINDTHCN